MTVTDPGSCAWMLSYLLCHINITPKERYSLLKLKLKLKK